jgi:hypothetical protein
MDPWLSQFEAAFDESSVAARRIRLTRRVGRALIGHQAINNHRVASTGRAAVVAMR